MESFFTIDQTNSNNRFVRAKQKIQKETLILKLSPVVVAPFTHNMSLYCNYCLKRNEKLSKCGGCYFFHYCCQKCQQSDWNVHKHECKIIKEIITKNFKITNQFLLVLRHLISEKHEINDTGKIIQEYIPNTFKFPEDKINFFEEMAIIMIKYLKIEIKNQDILINDIVSLISKLMINSFTIYAEDNDVIASATYYPSNYFNHSCQPNTYVIYKGRVQYIYTSKNIEEGEEISISYCDQIKPFYERQMFLMTNYFFTCSCKVCSDQLALKKTQIKCWKCKKGEILYEDKDHYSCTECKDKFNRCEFEKIYQYIKDLIANLSTLDASERLIKYKEFSGLIAPENGNYQDILEIMSRSLLTEENYEEAYKFDKFILKKLSTWYASNDPIIGWKYLELAKLTYFLQKLAKVKKYGIKASEILLKYYTLEEVSELKEILMESDTKFKYQLLPSQKFFLL